MTVVVAIVLVQVVVLVLVLLGVAVLVARLLQLPWCHVGLAFCGRCSACALWVPFLPLLVSELLPLSV